MRIAKWGNSLALRLPSAVVDALDLKHGDEIAVRIARDGAFEIERDGARDAALATLRRLRRPLPPGFRFDRDEAHER